MVDVVHFHKCSHPVILPVVPRMVKEGMTFPLSPCECHIPTVESMLGSSRHHHFLGDGHAYALCKSLALLNASVEEWIGGWNVGKSDLQKLSMSQ